MSVTRAYLRGIGLPPVELIQIGEVYFVRDGHHRISVAAALGQQEIDAMVTVWHAPAPVVHTCPAVGQVKPHSWRGFLPRLAWWSAAEA